MHINKDNYERFLIDYLDGTLHPSLEDELRSFINSNSELKAELELLLSVQHINPTNEEKTDFSFLKKPIDAEPTQEINALMIGAMEGELNNEDQKALNRDLILYPQLKTELALFAYTKMQPDLSVVFTEKQSLKRKHQAKFFPLYAKWMTIAAVVLLLGIGSIVYVKLQHKENFNTDIAQQKPIHSNSKINKNPYTKQMAVINKAVKSKEQISITVQYRKIKKLMVEPTEIMPLILQKGMNDRTICQLPVPLPDPTREPLKSVPVMPQAPAYAQQYLSPKEWLLQLFKQQVPQSKETVNALLNDGSKNAAIKLLNQTTGITFAERKDSTGNRSGYAIIARHFAIERSIKTDY